eukprot:12909693-Prorocentrum_lima.AAC.1
MSRTPTQGRGCAAWPGGAYNMTPYPRPARWEQQRGELDWLMHGEVSLEDDVVTTPTNGVY